MPHNTWPVKITGDCTIRGIPNPRAEATTLYNIYYRDNYIAHACACMHEYFITRYVIEWQLDVTCTCIDISYVCIFTKYTLPRFGGEHKTTQV